MKRLVHALTIELILCTGVFFWFSATANARSTDDADAVVMESTRATVSFDVGTNVPALRVHGKSSLVTARARISAGPKGVVLEQIDASMPVRSLQTGLGLRDEHMRKYVFTTSDGQIPDVRFSGERAECVKAGSGQPAMCTVSGELIIRDIAKPFTITLNINEQNDGLRASGEGTVKLSSYGIEQPSQLGVHTTDEVTLKLELTARRSITQVRLDSRGER